MCDNSVQILDENATNDVSNGLDLVAALARSVTAVHPGEAGSDSFDMTSASFLLTYSGEHLDKTLWERWFRRLTGKTNAFRKDATVIIAHETGENGDHPHTHVLLHGTTPKMRLRLRGPRALDYPFVTDGNPHPHIARVKYKDFMMVYRYLTKEDAKVKSDYDAWYVEHGAEAEEEIMSFPEKVWSCKTLNAALSKFSTPSGSNATQIRALWKTKPYDYEGDLALIREKPWFSFFEQLHVQGDARGRTIHWIYDSVGNTGKSLFARWLCLKYPNEVLSMSQTGGVRDLPTIIMNARSKGNSIRTVVLDLARDMEQWGLYAPLEALKNGFLTATKYDGGTVFLKSPTIFVFANFWPQVQRMSRDRWQFYELYHRLASGEKASSYQLNSGVAAAITLVKQQLTDVTPVWHGNGGFEMQDDKKLRVWEGLPVRGLMPLGSNSIVPEVVAPPTRYAPGFAPPRPLKRSFADVKRETFLTPAQADFKKRMFAVLDDDDAVESPLPMTQIVDSDDMDVEKPYEFIDLTGLPSEDDLGFSPSSESIVF